MSIEELISVIVYDYMWGLPLVVFILASGAYITVRSGFFQFKTFGKAMKHAFSNFFGKNQDNKSAGVLSSMEAMSTALGTTIGVGNIGGVATAIALGGPGAVFWMWVAGLFGMVIKSSEITLAVHYRSKDGAEEAYGGPNYYMSKAGKEKNMKGFFAALSILFAVGFSLSYFINIQTYTVAEAMTSTFGFDMLVSAIVFTVILYVIISGGMKSVGKWATIFVPFMCLFYFAGCFIILGKNFAEIPHAFGLIFEGAFTGTAAFGGFAGATMATAIKTGMARSVFSNEAGWGTSPMIHASAKVNHPVKQGMLGIFEVFMDTFVICTLTCLIILVTGEWATGSDGASLTLSAFEGGMGVFGRYVLAIGIFLFGLTTSSGLYAQIEVVLRYVVGESKIKDFALKFYKWTYPLPSLILVMIAVFYEFDGTTVWLISDAGVALPIFINILALFMLAPKFASLIKDYNARFLGKGTVDPNFKIFYEDDQDREAKDSIEKELA